MDANLNIQKVSRFIIAFNNSAIAGKTFYKIYQCFSDACINTNLSTQHHLILMHSFDK